MNIKRHMMCLLIVLSATQAMTAQSLDSGIKVENKQAQRTAIGMTVAMDLNLDDVTLRSNKRIILTPIVRGQNEERTMPQVIVNGRKQQIEYERKGHKKYADDVTVVRRYNGTEQSVHYTAILPAEDWMVNSDIIITEDSCGCGNLEGSDMAMVCSMRNPSVAFVTPVAEKEKSRSLEGSAYIDFPVNQTVINPEYRRNTVELKKINATIDSVRGDKDVTITGIWLKGYASPESPYEHNKELAIGRTAALKDYVQSLYHFKNGIITTDYEAEDWAGLRAYVDRYRIENSEAILAIIDTPMDLDAKELRIKTEYPAQYKFLLENCYPALRHTDYRVNYNIRTFTDIEEIKRVFATQPQKLSMNEMYLIAQTYEPGTEEFNKVFETAVRLFADDPTANLNAACMQIENGDYEAAERYLEKSGNLPETWNARGVIAAHDGRTDEAVRYFQRASDAGLQTATDNLRLMRGDY